MPGAHIDQGELLKLQQSIDDGEAPDGVLKVLSSPEYELYCNYRSTFEIISSIRKRIFNGTPLPEDFSETLAEMDIYMNPFSLQDNFIKYSDQIAILCEHLNEVAEIRKWMIRTLANHLSTNEQNIGSQLRFTENRTWFDGPVAVSIVEDRRDMANQF
jgi:hypothetical protein